MKNVILAVFLVPAALAAHAADYDYEVEYVKSAGGSVVKTDLLPGHVIKQICHSGLPTGNQNTVRRDFLEQM